MFLKGLIMKNIERDLFFDLNFETNKDAISFLGNILYKKGYVTYDFTSNVLEREKSYPTGLPCQPFGIAIPHTERDFVIHECFTFCRCKKGVDFYSILNDGSIVSVNFIFLLALKDGEDHLNFLKQITDFYQNESVLNDLYQASDIDAMYSILSNS